MLATNSRASNVALNQGGSHGADCMMGNAPHVGKHPIHSLDAVEAKTRITLHIRNNIKYPNHHIRDTQPLKDK